MKVNKKLMTLAVLFLVLNMITATQYAVTKLGYTYSLVHPCDASIRFIGSDNSSDGDRVLRVADGNNDTNIQLTLRLGSVYSANMEKTFTAAFGIVNEETYALNITHINVSSVNHTYMKIYLHGNRTENANSTATDPSGVLMWDNDTMVNASDTTAWILAPGNATPSEMCYNISDRAKCTVQTPWDETANVRYSTTNYDAVSNVSDFVWVQITVSIPKSIEGAGTHSGTIWIHLESEVGA